MVLQSLDDKGVFPPRFEENEMAEGIKGMLRVDERERWSCAQVREWLAGIVERCGGS